MYLLLIVSFVHFQMLLYDFSFIEAKDGDQRKTNRSYMYSRTGARAFKNIFIYEVENIHEKKQTNECKSSSIQCQFSVNVNVNCSEMNIIVFCKIQHSKWSLFLTHDVKKTDENTCSQTSEWQAPYTAVKEKC